MTGMHNSLDSYLIMATNCLLMSVLGGSLGLFAGTTSTDIKSVIQIMPLFFVPFILLAGFMINTTALGFFSFMAYISPIKYGMELAVRAEFTDDSDSIGKCWKNYLLEFFGYDIGLFWCYLILICIIVVFRFIAWWQINHISKR